MGRSRGGLTTKLHAAVDACGLPFVLKLTEGQAHDGHSAADMFDTLAAGHTLLADRAYDATPYATRWPIEAHGPTSSQYHAASKSRP